MDLPSDDELVVEEFDATTYFDNIYEHEPTKVNDKVMIPHEAEALLGQDALKSMEKETGAKIIISGRSDSADDPLQAYVSATNAESVKKAVAKINEIIHQEQKEVAGSHTVVVDMVRKPLNKRSMVQFSFLVQLPLRTRCRGPWLPTAGAAKHPWSTKTRPTEVTCPCGAEMCYLCKQPDTQKLIMRYKMLENSENEMIDQLKEENMIV